MCFIDLFCGKYKNEVRELNRKVNAFDGILRRKEKYIEVLEKHIVKLENELAKETKDIVSENYWNSKYPKIKKFYIRHETDGTYYIDVRNFFTPYDEKVPTFSGTDDEIAIQALKWVMKNIKYVSDKSQYGYEEYWEYPYQVLKRKRADCEGGMLLLASILLKSGVKYWKVRATAGLVKIPRQHGFTGHAYLTYYCEETDKWVILDWCYYPTKIPISEREDYKDNVNYQDVWFSFNQKYIFGTGTKSGLKYIKD